ncbi:fatty acid-binding protein, adipocyte-like [Mercenaria mercenaria]|uniref:fatty acid-binding protein, adipocyte-like n=1 Tax=Mercenaria mercenaria TaxID=6596 RepID=UPI00234E4825|nr:fatty acid-binding protein, adipocyte-like [Mercenaria mercenaria]
MEGFDESIGGKWKLLRNEKFDEYLGKMGIGYIKRKVACAFTTVMELIKLDDNRIRIITDGPKHSDAEIKLGEEVEECDPFDNKIKVKVNWCPESKILKTESYPIDGSKAKKAFVERKIDQTSGELIMEITLPDEDFVCRRYFKKV